MSAHVVRVIHTTVSAGVHRAGVIFSPTLGVVSAPPSVVFSGWVRFCAILLFVVVEGRFLDCAIHKSMCELVCTVKVNEFCDFNALSFPCAPQFPHRLGSPALFQFLGQVAGSPLLQFLQANLYQGFVM